MENKNAYIIVHERGMKHLIPAENIVRIESVRVYSIFHLRNSTQQFVSSRNLGKVQHELNPEMFLRVHRSHIINLYEVKAFKNARCGKVILSDGTVINVAQRRKTEFLKHLSQLNKKTKWENARIKNDPRAIIRIDITKHTR